MHELATFEEINELERLYGRALSEGKADLSDIVKIPRSSSHEEDDSFTKVLDKLRHAIVKVEGPFQYAFRKASELNALYVDLKYTSESKVPEITALVGKNLESISVDDGLATKWERGDYGIGGFCDANPTPENVRLIYNAGERSIVLEAAGKGYKIPISRLTNSEEDSEKFILFLNQKREIIHESHNPILFQVGAPMTRDAYIKEKQKLGALLL